LEKIAIEEGKTKTIKERVLLEIERCSILAKERRESTSNPLRLGLTLRLTDIAGRELPNNWAMAVSGGVAF
jgi:hypothetical protein